MTKADEFPELKSQEEINRENGWDWWKWYIGFSFVISNFISILMVIGLVKWIFFS